jgi:group II intron reverse transcriptase/maturase
LDTNTELETEQFWKTLCSPAYLYQSWLDVEEKGGKPGVDGVGIEEFAAQLPQAIDRLAEELSSGTYHPLPVLGFNMVKGPKVRQLGIFSVRDRVVQHGLLRLIQPDWETVFLDCSYAYRHGRGVQKAVAQVTQILAEGCCHVLRADIDSFFDTMNHQVLLDLISERLTDHRLLNLIKCILRITIYTNNQFHQMTQGVIQGGTCSPFFSNIYLHTLDRIMMQGGHHYLRFSDDIIILAQSKEQLIQALEQMTITLRQLKLGLNDSKTKISHLNNGFSFLGHYWDRDNLMARPAHSLAKVLEERIAIQRRQGRNEKYIAKTVTDMIVGWQRFYKGERFMGKVDDPAILVGLIRQLSENQDKQQLEELVGQRLHNELSSPELAIDLARQWHAKGYPEMALYEAVDQVIQGNPQVAASIFGFIVNGDHSKVVKLLSLLNKLDYKTESFWHDFSALCGENDLFRLANYAELIAARKANTISENLAAESLFKHGEEDSAVGSFGAKDSWFPSAARDNPNYTDEEVRLFGELFSGREGMYAREYLGEDGRRAFVPVDQYLDSAVIQRHLTGQETVGIYLIRKNNTVKLLTIDVDIQKDVFQANRVNSVEIQRLLGQTFAYAVLLQKVAAEAGIAAYIEDSGQRGHHVWIFFQEAIRAGEARALAQAILNRVGPPPEPLRSELFPDTERVREGGRGCLVKLPLGRHSKTGRWALFLGADGEPIKHQGNFLRSIRQVSWDELTKARHFLFDQTRPVDSINYPQRLMLEPIGEEIWSKVTTAPRRILEGCSLTHYLVKKAETTGYLSHYERLTLLCIFGHLDKEGTEFIHLVMRQCVNYNPTVTDRFIKRKLPNPISCARIRERYPDVSAALGCDCQFRTSAGTYPSPVIHALGQSAGSAGGSSRHSSIYRINQLAKNLMDLRRQQREITRKIKACQNELDELFAMNNISQIETDIGILTRRETNDGIEWKLEL